MGFVLPPAVEPGKNPARPAGIASSDGSDLRLELRSWGWASRPRSSCTVLNSLRFTKARTRSFTSVPLWDMLCFTVVFSLAILWRQKLEYHRRLMLIASCALTAAAWGRFPESVLPGFWFYAGVDLLIIMGVIRDLLVNRKIHRVYLIALPLFVAGQIAIAHITYTEWWMRFSHSILI